MWFWRVLCQSDLQLVFEGGSLLDVVTILLLEVSCSRARLHFLLVYLSQLTIKHLHTHTHTNSETKQWLNTHADSAICVDIPHVSAGDYQQIL